MKTILLSYSRIPMTTTYEALIKRGTLNEISQELECPLLLAVLSGVRLETVIVDLHTCMRAEQPERVFVMQTPYQEKSSRLQKMHELSSSLKDLILNDLPKAKLAFAPITDWKGTSHE